MTRHTPLSQNDFLYELVSCPSVYTREKEVAELSVRQMAALGFRDVHRDAAGNAVGFWGSAGAKRQLMLLGHIDTVPGEIPVRIERDGDDEILHGRGAVDAKAPFATFVQAVSQLDRGIPAEIIVVGAVEEEASSSKGAHQVLQDFEEPDGVIIGEPSNTSGITLGYKGRLLAELSISRTMTHSAHQHVSAAEAGIAFHLRVQSMVEKLNEGKDGIFAPLDYSVQSFQTQANGFSESANVKLGFRLGPSFTPSGLEETLRDLHRAHRESIGDIRFLGHEIPVRFDKKNRLATALRAAMRAEGVTPRHLHKTGTSDMNVLASKWGCPMVAYGPGDSALDHTPEEHIKLGDYQRAIRILYGALTRLAGG